MKKRLFLLSLLTLGSISYAQTNKVIVPVKDNLATASLGIDVSGKVFSKADQSLVIDVTSAASPNGTGFAFAMPDLFTNGEPVSLPGSFSAKVLSSSGTPVKLGDSQISVNLLKGNTKDTTATSDSRTGLSGAAHDVTLAYSVSGSVNGGVKYDGTVAVKATPGTQIGTYADNSVSLIVEYKGDKGE